MSERTTLSLTRITGDTPEEIAANALYIGQEFFGTDELIVDIGNFFLANDARLSEDEGNFLVNSARVYLKSEEE